MAVTQKKPEELEYMPTTRIMTPAQNAQQAAQQKNEQLQLAAQQAPSANIQQQSQAQQSQAQQQYTPYTGLQGISGQTADNMGRLMNGYQPSEAVTAAQQALKSLQDTRPGAYNSRYNAQLEQVLQKITNPQQFNYSFNGDELFKQYADRYVQQGKQASQDAMGQAAGLTGGYGNSYGQMVGQQTYDQYLQGLYDKGMDLYDRALQRWQAEQNGLLDQFNVLSQADQSDYGRYRDTVGDWENERNYLTNRADTEAERDFNRYNTELNYWTNLGQAENAGYMQQQQFDEQQRQFDAQMAENQRQWDQQYAYTKMSEDRKDAYDNACAILKSGKMPSDALLKQAGLSKEDAQKMMAQVKKAGSGRGGSTSNAGAKYYYDETTNKYYVINDNGYAEKVNFNDIPTNGTIYEGAISQSVLNDANNKLKTDFNAATEDLKKKTTSALKK